MTATCPICQAGARDIFEDVSPILPMLGPKQEPSSDLFTRLSLASCLACGHLFNRAFDPRLMDRMYGEVGLTNLPVHPTMLQRLDDLFQWLPADAIENRHVIEIGAGGGHFARILASRAAKVTVYEPCRALTPDMMPEPNISLVTDFFPSDRKAAPADLVICRQILEHAADPCAMLREIAAALKPEGLAYIEVPRAEFIIDWAAALDLHIQHVQYFTVASLVLAARRAGLSAQKFLSIKDGHDFGLLFSRGGSAAFHAAPATMPTDDLGARLTERRDHWQSLAGLPRPLGLYAATMVTQRFLGLFPSEQTALRVFDDSPVNLQNALFTTSQRIPAEAPSAARTEDLDTIAVGAYLHDLAIAERLRRLGFKGRILSLRPTPMPSNTFALAAA